MSTIAERFLLLRGKTKQGEFATLLNINPNTLRNYENGRVLPNQAILERICVQFSVSAEWLLLGHGPMYREKEEHALTTPQSAQAQPCETTNIPLCARCEKLESKLEKLEERWEKAEERKDALVEENQRLLKENGILREENATLRERQRKEQASFFDESQKMPETRRKSGSSPELHP